MGEQTHTSYISILELVKNIKKGIATVSALNQELSGKLTKLGDTFQDDGYGTVEAYVSSSQSKVNDAAEDFGIVMNQLIDYAIALKDSEDQI